MQRGEFFKIEILGQRKIFLYLMKMFWGEISGFFVIF